jgi:hypothetical protein
MRATGAYRQVEIENRRWRKKYSCDYKCKRLVKLVLGRQIPLISLYKGRLFSSDGVVTAAMPYFILSHFG